MTIGGMVRRLMSRWSTADATTRMMGLSWYPEARRTVQTMAHVHGCSYHVAAGVVAALSPRVYWARNLKAAHAVLAGRVPTGIFGTSYRKAWRIYNGERPLHVLSGLKVRAFYMVLVGNEQAAVIDTWMLRAVGYTGRNGHVTAKVYRAVARAVWLVARKVRASVAGLQATIWVAVRGRSG